MSPSTAMRRPVTGRCASATSAASIDVGFALYASLRTVSRRRSRAAPCATGPLDRAASSAAISSNGMPNTGARPRRPCAALRTWCAPCSGTEQAVPVDRERRPQLARRARRPTIAVVGAPASRADGRPRRPAARPASVGVHASSAFSTASPPAGSALEQLAEHRGRALGTAEVLGVREPDVGDDADVAGGRCRTAARCRRRTAPHLLTTTRAAAGVLHKVIGRPNSLLYDSGVRVAAQRARAPAASRSLVDVFPVEPATATTSRSVRSARTDRATSCSARKRVVDHARARGPDDCASHGVELARSTSATCAPASNAARTKSWPSRCVAQRDEARARVERDASRTPTIGHARVGIAVDVAAGARARSRPRSSRSCRASELFARDDPVVERHRHAVRRSGRSRDPCRRSRRRRRRAPRAARRGSRRAGRARPRAARALGRTPGEHVGRDRRRVLGTRVVGGEHRDVAEAASRRSPITGRLARSRSPPQPKTTSTRPSGRRERARRVAAPIRERVGRVRVVDEHRERLARVDALHPAGDHDRRVRARARSRRGRSRRRARSPRPRARSSTLKRADEPRTDGELDRPRTSSVNVDVVGRELDVVRGHVGRGVESRTCTRRGRPSRARACEPPARARRRR